MSGIGGLIVVVDGIALGMLLFTVASGLALSYGAGGVLNLAHGVFWLAGAYLGWWLIEGTWIGFGLAAACAIVAGGAGGYLLALLLRRAPGHLWQALMSIGVALIGGWLLTHAFGSQPLSVDPPLPLAGSVSIAGRAYPLYRLVFTMVGGGWAVALWWLLAHTRAGILIRASGDDPRVLDTLGVNSRLVRTGVVAAACAVATLAGTLGGPLIGPAPGVDHQVLILSLVIVVVGGARSIPGIAVAALAVGQIHTTAAVLWPRMASLLPYAALVVALAVRAGPPQQPARSL